MTSRSVHWKRWATALVVPLALLVVAEAALRVAGVSRHDPDIQVSTENGVVHVSVRAPYSAIDTQAMFVEHKPEDAFRIAFVGASTTRGVPYAQSISFPAIVTARLQSMFPDRSIEGINLGVPTKAVRTAKGLAEVALEMDIDLLVLEAGHNEFLVNTLPAAEGFMPGLRRWLSDFRIFRVLQRARNHWDDRGFDQNVRRALGEQQDRHALVGRAARSRRDRVERYFAEDVASIVAAANDRGVAVVVVVPPTRWWGFWPERSFIPDDMCAADRQALSDRIAALHDSLEPDVEPWTELLLQVPGVAIAEYRAGDVVAAWQDDPTPLGASPRLQRILIDTATEQAAQGGVVAIADAQRRFSERSEDGRIDAELLVDHCHPSITGQYLLASVVLEAIRDTGCLVDPSDWPGVHDLHLAPTLSRLGVNPLLVDTWHLQAALADVSYALISFAPVPYAERALRHFDAQESTGYGSRAGLAGARVMRGIAELLVSNPDATRAMASFRQAFEADPATASRYLEAVIASSPRVAQAFRNVHLEMHQGVPRMRTRENG